MKKGVVIGITIIVAIGILAGYLLTHRVIGEQQESQNAVQVNLGNLNAEDEDSQSYWNPDNHGIAKGDGGYYYFDMSSGKAEILMFFDESTQESIPVCGKADCTHDNEQCNAYFTLQSSGLENGAYHMQIIYYYHNYLYVIKTVMAKLVRVSPDGSERKEIGDLFENEGGNTISLVFHGENVYAYDDTGHAGSESEQTETIKKISLASGTSKDVYSYTGIGGSIDRGRNVGDHLFFVVREYSLDKNSYEQKMQYQGLYEYQYDTEQTEKVIDANICDYYIDIDNNAIYYFVTGEGLYRCNMSGGEASLIYPANDSLLVCKMSYDGDYIYLYNTGMGSLTDARGLTQKLLFVLDKDGNERNRIESGVVYFGDGNYIFAMNKYNKFSYIEKDKITTADDWTVIE